MKPLVTMPDVLLACGELNKRERVAVQWVIDRYERERSAGLTVDTSPKVHGFTDEEIAIAAECYACGPAGRLNIERAIGYEDAIRWVRDNGYLATAPNPTDEELYRRAMDDVTPDALERMDKAIKAIDAPAAVLTVDEAHRAACDAYNNYSADNAPLTWGEYCRQCLTSALEAKSGNDES